MGMIVIFLTLVAAGLTFLLLGYHAPECHVAAGVLLR